jgi:hypothetical protein
VIVLVDDRAEELEWLRSASAHFLKDDADGDAIYDRYDEVSSRRSVAGELPVHEQPAKQDPPGARCP